jgi:hypothetical protein
MNNLGGKAYWLFNKVSDCGIATLFRSADLNGGEDYGKVCTKKTIWEAIKL